MKNLKIILFTLVFYTLLFQTAIKAQNTNYTIKHDTCLDKKFSVVFYLVQDSVFSLPNNPSPPANPLNFITTYSLNNIISILNNAFSRICVSFENCNTAIIPNYEYNNWTQGTTDSIVTSSWYTENTINIYIASNNGALNQVGHALAYASNTPTSSTTPRPKDFIVLRRQNKTLSPAYLVSNNAGYSGSSIVHAMGHFFGLLDTYAEISSNSPAGPSLELVNGSNSQTYGDGISDTDADHYSDGFNASTMPIPPCAYDYTVGAQDATGNFYVPPVDNLMSHYTCRCRFSQEQYNKMAYFILTRRMYLH